VADIDRALDAVGLDTVDLDTVLADLPTTTADAAAARGLGHGVDGDPRGCLVDRSAAMREFIRRRRATPAVRDRAARLTDESVRPGSPRNP
jgi:hypothetical protein